MAAKKQKEKNAQNHAHRDGIIFIALLAASVYLFICNFGLGGAAGQWFSHLMFGVFGIRAYIAPALLPLAAYFLIRTRASAEIIRKTVAGAVLFVLAGILIDLVTGRLKEIAGFIDIPGFYERGRTLHRGGGLLPDILGSLSYRYLSAVGTMLVILVLAVICLEILSNSAFLNSVRDSSQHMIEHAGEDYRKRKIRRAKERERDRKRRLEEEKEREIEAQWKQDEKILKKVPVRGVTTDTDLKAEEKQSVPAKPGADVDTSKPFREEEEDGGADTYAGGDDIHEITYVPDEKETSRHATSSGLIRKAEGAEDFRMPSTREADNQNREDVALKKTKAQQNARKKTASGRYAYPPLSLLKKADKRGPGQGAQELKETAQKLEKILQTFNVNARVVDYSKGPTVTRYELQPEVGVKVSRILNLADDIKLNLAATDIRFEAPIPGKVAVGIEVPNAENVTVTLRELLEDKAYQSSPSRLSFAVGKDIAGETVVADIARMPHLLIAGATGSGKSVCINTLILSLLYKADPQEVKLIMVDPKVVELNMYNGIPHLLIPVVTDPKKAAGALNWAVAEMEKRYRLFADAEVRDLEGYNRFIELHQGEDGFEKLPQIVLIVDELADLMMVSKSEVETAICRLAQLARAAGIHLIIATQRPSVDVITGLIKANMPSRIAFAVSSGVDSRTILDMNGAEKLLGKGDMLFFPQNYSKPVRVQGAFVSDKEIADVCEYLKKQAEVSYNEEIVKDIEKMQSGSGQEAQGAQGAGADGRDPYFEEAGRFIIGKDKASIGNLQRVFKIGFNRAARIMDQLCEAGVVGEEEGTKPRRILMTMEEFEAICTGEAKEAS